MRTSALFGAKNSGFFEFYGGSARTRGVESMRTFYGQGDFKRWSIFRDFVRKSFMDGSQQEDFNKVSASLYHSTISKNQMK